MFPMMVCELLRMRRRNDGSLWMCEGVIGLVPITVAVVLGSRRVLAD